MLRVAPQGLPALVLQLLDQLRLSNLYSITHSIVFNLMMTITIRIHMGHRILGQLAQPTMEDPITTRQYSVMLSLANSTIKEAKAFKKEGSNSHHPKR